MPKDYISKDKVVEMLEKAKTPSVTYMTADYGDQYELGWKDADRSYRETLDNLIAEIKKDK